MSLCFSPASWIASLCALRMKTELEETLGPRPCCFICISSYSVCARKSPPGGESPFLQPLPQRECLCVCVWCVRHVGAVSALQAPLALLPLPSLCSLFPSLSGLCADVFIWAEAETLVLNTPGPPPQLTPLSWVEMKVDRIIMLMSTPLTGQLYQYQLSGGTFTLC